MKQESSLMKTVPETIRKKPTETRSLLELIKPVLVTYWLIHLLINLVYSKHDIMDYTRVYSPYWKSTKKNQNWDIRIDEILIESRFILAVFVLFFFVFNILKNSSMDLLDCFKCPEFRFLWLERRLDYILYLSPNSTVGGISQHTEDETGRVDDVHLVVLLLPPQRCCNVNSQ